MPSYQGNIEKVSSRTVVGWVCDLKSPDRHLDVTVSVNGEEIGTVFANRFCPSLAERSLRGRHHGFQLVIPERIQLVYHVEAIADSGSYNIPPATPNLISKETNRPLPEAWKRKTGTYRFPSVFILGAAKCGTTSLHSYLMQHPDIAMSNPKEPYFFEAEYNYGPTYYLNRYFNYWRGESVVGEARHRNLYLPYVPERILSYNPDAKLIVILRNPSERAISHWWHWYAREINPVMNTVSHVWHRRPRKASLVRKAVSRWRHRHCQQLETLPLREALLADWKRISSGPSFANTADIDRYAKSLEPDGKGLYRTYLDSGYYYEQLIRYIQLFGRIASTSFCLRIWCLTRAVRSRKRLSFWVLTLHAPDGWSMKHLTLRWAARSST